MKNLKLIAGIFLILTAFTFTSCDNEPIDSAIDLDDFGNPTPGTAIFKADFSGDTWTGTQAEALISGDFISIGATRADGSTFSFFIDANGTGTFPANTNILAYTPSGSEFGYTSTNLANPDENTGSVTISAINTTTHTISGTFSFKGYWSDVDNTSIIPVQFTNGVFTNIPYTSSTVTPGTDTFFAKVDGVEFVEDQIDVAFITGSTLPDQTSIAGSKSNDDALGINVDKSLPVGTYPITGVFGNDDVVRGSMVINDVLYNADSGSITITSKTATRIAGTFTMVVKNFTTSATKNITEGKFDVELP